MIKTLALTAGTILALITSSAEAAVIYDTIHPTVTQTSGTGIAYMGPLAVSFSAPTGAAISDLKFLMNTTSNSDGGSVLVWLVPDDGTGGAGRAGAPAGGSLFTGAIQIGSIFDSAFATSVTSGAPGQPMQLIDLPVSVSVGPGEWWIGLTQSTGNTRLAFDLGFDPTSANSVGTAFQKDFSTQAAPLNNYALDTFFTPPSVVTPGRRAFEVTVLGTVPEPTTLAVLGTSLLSLGVLRRRRR